MRSNSPISLALRPLHAHLPHGQQFVPDDPQVRQRTQRDDLRRVPLQTTAAHLHITKLLLEHKGCSTLARMHALVHSNWSISASRSLPLSNARRNSGRMATCLRTPVWHQAACPRLGNLHGQKHLSPDGVAQSKAALLHVCIVWASDNCKHVRHGFLKRIPRAHPISASSYQIHSKQCLQHHYKRRATSASSDPMKVSTARV